MIARKIVASYLGNAVIPPIVKYIKTIDLVIDLCEAEFFGPCRRVLLGVPK